ncbi:valine--tRNA ligase [Metamycoplasma buccale]|uniref:valine--tRNA ligase n=1 Tax=Metamycoplasma buccale TaxID=55602 RepID=UPI00398F8DDB
MFTKKTSLSELKVTNLKKIIWDENKSKTYIHNLSFTLDQNNILGFLGDDSYTKKIIFNLLVDNKIPLTDYQGLIEYKLVNSDYFSLSYKKNDYCYNVGYGFDEESFENGYQLNLFNYLMNYLKKVDLIQHYTDIISTTWTDFYLDYEMLIKSHFANMFYELQKQINEIFLSTIKEIKSFNNLPFENKKSKVLETLELFYSFAKKIINEYQTKEYFLMHKVYLFFLDFSNGKPFTKRNEFLNAKQKYLELNSKYNKNFNYKKLINKLKNNKVKNIKSSQKEIFFETKKVLSKINYDLKEENKFYLSEFKKAKNKSSYVYFLKNYLINKKLLAFFASNHEKFIWLNNNNLNQLFDEINEVKSSISSEVELINYKNSRIKLAEQVKQIVNTNFVINIDYCFSIIEESKEFLAKNIEQVQDLDNDSYEIDLSLNNFVNIENLKLAENNYINAKNEYFWNVNKAKKNYFDDITFLNKKAVELSKINQSLFKNIVANFNNFVKKTNFSIEKNVSENLKLIAKTQELINLIKKIEHKFISSNSIFNKKMVSKHIVQLFVTKYLIFSIIQNANISLDKLESEFSALSIDEKIAIEIEKIIISEPSLIVIGNAISKIGLRKRNVVLNYFDKYILENHIMGIYFLNDFKISSKVTTKLYVINNSRIIEQGKTNQIMENPINPLVKKMLGYNDAITNDNYNEYLTNVNTFENFYKYQIDSMHYVWCTWNEFNRWVTEDNLKNEKLKKQMFFEPDWKIKTENEVKNVETFEETMIFNLDNLEMKLEEEKMDKVFDHKIVEKDRNQKWIKGKFFISHDESKRPFTVILPPPNITGNLHIGHALDTYIPDTIIRYKKIQGFDVLWLPGKDHAGIATQAVVEKKLAEQGLSKYTLGREKFIEEIWKWKDEYSANINNQWAKLGLALDYNNERFTLDKNAEEAVSKVFIELYNEGLIYRDTKPINWDPKLKTALSNIEVISKETPQKMYYLKYYLNNESNNFLEVATTRLETIPSDVALAINPSDKRASELVHKFVINPLTKEKLPIILSNKIDPNFGTGIMKVSAHAIDDIEIIRDNNLEIKECIDKDGKMNELALEFKGLDRFDARNAIFEKLTKENLVTKIENIISNVGYSERSKEAIEILVQPQWFVKMGPLAKDLLRHLQTTDGVEFIPERFKQTLIQWMKNAYDWTISRQIWWGHRIPAWYKNNSIKVQINKPGEGWVQDEDVLDTWFSSALSPFVFLGWPQNKNLIKRYYPTSLLVTGYDIIFFWVARMYFQSLFFIGKKPFEQVFIHGLVRDNQGRKMSKSLGNGINPIDVINDYGSDVLRMSLIFNCTPGQDINYGEDKIKTARLFINKFWNVSRLIANTSIKLKNEFTFDKLDYFDKWILHKFILFKNNIDLAMNKYEFNNIFKYIQDFINNDLSSWYLEFLKFKNNNYFVHFIFKEILITLHPFLPFLTDYLFENIYHEELLEARQLIFTDKQLDSIKDNSIPNLIELITILRKFREDKAISKSQILFFYPKDFKLDKTNLMIIKKMTNFEIKENNDFLVKLTYGEISIMLSEDQKTKEILDLEKLIEFSKKEIEFNKKLLENSKFMEKASEEIIKQKQRNLEVHEEKLKFYSSELELRKKSK